MKPVPKSAVSRRKAVSWSQLVWSMITQPRMTRAWQLTVFRSHAPLMPFSMGGFRSVVKRARKSAQMKKHHTARASQKRPQARS